MSLALLIYLAEVAGNLRNALGPAVFFSFLGWVFCFMGKCAMEEVPEDEAPSSLDSAVNKGFKFCFWVFVIVVPLLVFTPQTKTIYLMAGATVAEDVVLSEEAQKARQILNNKLDELLVEQQQQGQEES